MRNIRKTSSKRMFADFTNELASQLETLGRYRTAETYLSTARSFLAFNKGHDMLLSDITSDTILRYEAFLINERHIKRNSSSFYMRIMRSIYNKAAKKRLVADNKPFDLVYTGVDKTVKRALPVSDMKRIIELDLSRYPRLCKARDIFLFSFYTRGMSFVDMAYLKKSDLRNGVLEYYRRKTGQRLCIKWERCMQDIIDKHGTGIDDYLMPIIIKKDIDVHKQYANAMSNINIALKRISEKLNLRKPLTMYVARHSWASIAKSKNIPISVISEGMGHDSEATTQIYLSSIETSVIDRANRMIIKTLLGK